MIAVGLALVVAGLIFLADLAFYLGRGVWRKQRAYRVARSMAAHPAGKGLR